MTSTFHMPPPPKPAPMRVLWLPDFDVPLQDPDPAWLKADDVL
jgi:hypothetical protein